MQCYCEKYFSEKLISRILIDCGHSLCEECIQILLQAEERKCPYCQTDITSQAIEQFPINHVILSSCSKMCPVHSRKIEAFCMEDLQMLCMHCITKDGHVQHQLSDLLEAGNYERRLLLESFSKSNNQNQQADEYRIKLSNLQSNINLSYEEASKEVSNLYDEIFQIIDKQKQLRLDLLKDQMQTHQTELSSYEEALKEQVESLLEFTNDVQNLKNEDEYELASKAKKRHLLIDRLNTKLPDISRSSLIQSKETFQKLNRSKEFSLLSKIFSQDVKEEQIQAPASLPKVASQQQLTKNINFKKQTKNTYPYKEELNSSKQNLKFVTPKQTNPQKSPPQKTLISPRACKILFSCQFIKN